jgi:transposase
MYRYTTKERVELVRYTYSKQSQNEASRLFRLAHPEKACPNQSTISRLVNRFEITGSVLDKKITGRPKKSTTYEKSVDVLARVSVEPTTSLRKLSSEVGISLGSTHRILKENKFHPFKLVLQHYLNEDDSDRRLEFCEKMKDKCDTDSLFLESVLFSDECSFYMNSRTLKHNAYYWSQNNPHWIAAINHQDKRKLNVWAGIIGNRIIGPFFIEGELNGEKYLDILIREIGPALDDLGLDTEIWFQQDGAPAHYATIIRQHLDNVFPGHWIGRRGTIDWPARSPDLTPLDFFLWGYLKAEVYKTQPQSLDDLKHRIISECHKISCELLTRVRNEIYDRFGYCLAADGLTFEHLIK